MVFEAVLVRKLLWLVAGILSKFGSFACNWKCDACGIATFVTAYRDASSHCDENISKAN